MARFQRTLRARWGLRRSLLTCIVGASLSSDAAAFRPAATYGHRGIAQRAIDRFKFLDPEANNVAVGFTQAARNKIVDADEQTDIYSSIMALECFLDASADERQFPPFFVSPFHCDDDKLGECSRVVKEGLDTVVTTVMSGNVDKARACLGRIMHTVQDFYAHSTLVYKLFKGDQVNYQPPLSDDYGRAEREALFSGTHPSSGSIIGSSYAKDVCTGSVERIQLADPGAMFGVPVIAPPMTYQQYTGHVQSSALKDNFPLVSAYFPDLATSVQIPFTDGAPFPDPVEALSVLGYHWEPPRRRCGHGVVMPPRPTGELGVVFSPGMAKDDINQPERWQHDSAKELAEIASLKLIEAVRDQVGMRLAANSTAYSETMRKFLGLQPIVGVTVGSLGAAIDLSESMEPVLQGIRQSVNSFANGATNADPLAMAAEEAPTLVIVGFSDPEIGEPIVSRDRQAFRAALNELSVGQLGDGGDCPERSIAALQKLVDALPENSRAFSFTNSSSKDQELKSALIASAQAKNITIDVNLSGSCSPIDENLRQITEATGGQLLQTERDDSGGPGQIMAVELENLTAGPQQLIARVSKRAAAQERVEFPVDSSIERLTVSIDLSGTEIVDATTAQKGTLTLTDPSGRVVPARVDALVGNMYTVDAPAPGVWAMSVAGVPDQTFTLVVRGVSSITLSEVSFAEIQGRIGHTGLMRTRNRPIPEQPTALMAHFEEQGASALRFGLLTLDGIAMSSFDVQPDPDLGDLVGTVVAPMDPFRIAVTGQRADGTPFQRVYPQVFAASPYRIVPVEDRAIFVPGRRHSLTFDVYNFGPDTELDLRATSTVDAEISVEPAQLAIAYGELRRISVSVLVPDDLPPNVQSVRVTARAGVGADDPNESLSSTVRIVASDSDGDGIADPFENGPDGDDPSYDGNGDGGADEAQDHVLSLPLFASQYATLVAADDVEVSEVRAEAMPLDAALPDDAILPLGAFLLSTRGSSLNRTYELHVGGDVEYRLNHLYLQPNGQGDQVEWLARGDYDAETRTLSVNLQDGSAVDLDPRGSRLTVLAAPGFGLDEEQAQGGSSNSEGGGCICSVPTSSQPASSARAWLGLAALATLFVSRARRRR